MAPTASQPGSFFALAPGISLPAPCNGEYCFPRSRGSLALLSDRFRHYDVQWLDPPSEGEGGGIGGALSGAHGTISS